MEGKRVDTKLLLFTLVLVLIVLLLLNYFFKNNGTDEIWNYKEITTALDVMYLGQRVTDRQTYYDLESIVVQYLNSYLAEYNGDKDTYKDYYNYLTEDYKRYLGKRKYIKVAENFLNKFYINMDSDYINMDTTQVLKNVYKFDDDVYMCELYSNSNEKTGYIAVRVNMNSARFNIVYIE